MRFEASSGEQQCLAHYYFNSMRAATSEHGAAALGVAVDVKT